MISGGIFQTPMNKRFPWALFTVFLFFLYTAPAQSGQIIIDSDQQFTFAKTLMERGEYLQAINEFERFIHFFPENENVPKARFFIGLCYLKGKNYETARKVLSEVYRTYRSQSIGGKALLMIGESYYRQAISTEAIHYFEKVIKEYPDTEIKNQAIYRLAWSRMQANQWQEASDTFKMVEGGSLLYGGSQILSELSLEGQFLPYKDPTTAGVLAGILPGMGHAYCGRYKDGLVALLVNGLFIWAAVESFDRDHEALGVILGFLELGWYSGNIYSAVNSAHKHNRKLKNDYLKSLPDQFRINLSIQRDGTFGLALKFDF